MCHFQHLDVHVCFAAWTSKRRVCHVREFTCDTDTCIARHQVCDLRTDCPGGQDENQTLCGKSTLKQLQGLAKQ